MDARQRKFGPPHDLRQCHSLRAVLLPRLRPAESPRRVRFARDSIFPHAAASRGLIGAAAEALALADRISAFPGRRVARRGFEAAEDDEGRAGLPTL